MINKVIGICYVCFIAVTSVFMFIIALLIRIFTGFFDKKLIILHLFTSFWASLYLWCMPAWSLKVYGREKMDRKKRYIIVANHQSQLDILVAFSLFFPFKWVSKSEVFRLPFIGWNMKLNRYIALKRGEKNSIRQMMKDCTKALQQGCSIFIFPEGTRSKTGELRKFKPGAFIMAKKMKVPILPVVIQGTREALPKHTLSFTGRHKITLKVLDEIPYERIKHMNLEDIAEMVRGIISREIKSNPVTA